jgi:preprotein translocase subunit Sec61beta
MATLQTPQQSAGILSFYDAPEKGPKLNAKLVVILIVVFALIVLVFDHFVPV